MYSFYPTPTFPNLFPNQMNMNVGTTQPSTTIQYVDGIKGAEQINLPANSSGIYLDNNQKDMYIIHTDANGKAVVKVCEYREKQKEKPKEYVTKEEFEKFKASMKGGVKHETNTNANTKGE